MKSTRKRKQFRGYWKVNCDGCYGKNMPYMIRNRIWKAVARETDVYLCLHCIERRLERRLEKKDFSSPENNKFNNGFYGFKWQDWVFRDEPNYIRPDDDFPPSRKLIEVIFEEIQAAQEVVCG